MWGGSANSRCLPSIVNGDRTKPTASRPPRAKVAARASHRGGAGGRLETDAVGGAPADHDDVAGLRGAAAAVAEHLATLDLVDVEHGGGRAQRRPVAEPQAGADARADVEVGVGGVQLVELLVGQVRDPDRRTTSVAGSVVRQPGTHDVVDETVHLGEVRSARQREVQRRCRPGVAGHRDRARRRPRGGRRRRGRGAACWLPPRARTAPRAVRRRRSRRSSTRDTVWTTRRRSASGTSSAGPNGRHGVSTSRSPEKRVATSGSSA